MFQLQSVKQEYSDIEKSKWNVIQTDIRTNIEKITKIQILMKDLRISLWNRNRLSVTCKKLKKIFIQYQNIAHAFLVSKGKKKSSSKGVEWITKWIQCGLYI